MPLNELCITFTDEVIRSFHQSLDAQYFMIKKVIDKGPSNAVRAHVLQVTPLPFLSKIDVDEV